LRKFELDVMICKELTLKEYMRFCFPYKKYSPQILIRRCGYARIKSRYSPEISYIRRLTSQPFPRFHIHIQEFPEYFEVNLHLDQKMVRGKGIKAHALEEEGEVLENEARRITAVIKKIYEAD